MRTIRSFFVILLISMAFSVVLPAQSAKITLRSVGTGKVSLTKGKVRSTVSLSGEIGGCPYVSAGFKRSLDKRGCAAPPASFELIDSVVKNNQTFVVIESAAQGNCNVCGQCGASESFTLIWLKLNARLRVVEKQSRIVESCIENLATVAPSSTVNEDTQESLLKLPLKAGRLTIDFEKTIYNADATSTTYEFSHLEYDRKTPERGFVIKTEKRAKSSASDQ